MGAPRVTVEKLRFNDTDQIGHVNNAAFVVLLEAGRVEMLFAAGLIDESQGIGGAIVRLELDFLAELNWPGEVRVETAIARLGTKSIQMRQRLFSGDTLVARAASVVVVIDMHARKALPLTDAWRARLDQWLVEDF